MRFGKAFFRLKGQYALVTVFNHPGLNQLFIIVRIRFLAQASVGIPRLDMDERLRIVIQPAVHHLQTIHESGRPGAEIRFPVTELIVIQPGLQRLLIDAFLCDTGKLLFDRLHEGGLVRKVRVLGDDAEIGLAKAVFIIAVNVLADLFVKQRLLQGRAGRTAEDIVKHLECNIALPVQVVPHHNVVGQIGVIRLRLAVRDGILCGSFFFLCKRRLDADFRIHFNPFKMGQVLPVQIIKLFRHIHISVQIDITVGRMIKFPVEFQKFFIRQLRNHIRVAAGLHGVWRIRIQGFGNLAFQHIVRRRKGALHFIVNHTVDGKLSFRALQLVVPSLLLEDFFLFINVGIEHRIQINMHQVLEIRVVAAGNRIYGFVRIGHGV